MTRSCSWFYKKKFFLPNILTHGGSRRMNTGLKQVGSKWLNPTCNPTCNLTLTVGIMTCLRWGQKWG